MKRSQTEDFLISLMLKHNLNISLLLVFFNFTRGVLLVMALPRSPCHCLMIWYYMNSMQTWKSVIFYFMEKHIFLCWQEVDLTKYD